MTTEQSIAGAPDTDSYQRHREQFDSLGYVVFENVLDASRLAAVRGALAPWLERNQTGRNDFEGLKSNRVYALLAKSSLFCELVTHPLPLAFAEAELGRSCLLSACLAINLHPGETVQPWHTDDSHIAIPPPRPSFGVSAFWAIDASTEENGATQVLPGSHLWDEHRIAGAVSAGSFSDRTVRRVDDDPGDHPQAVAVPLEAGSLMLAKGNLLHRGGANRSTASRLIVTPQYCPGWARQLENMMAAVPPATAAALPPRVQELLGYSIHPPFMGYVDGVHPKRSLE